MFFRAAMSLSFAVSAAFGQTRTVCEALAALTDLNGHEVKIRGVFASGDTGQALFAWPPCAQPTVRDGWVWRDFIRVLPAGGSGGVAGEIATYRTMAKAHPGSHIVVTLTGVLETRDHFETQWFGDGLLHPIGFKWFVAQLAYRSMDHFEAVPLKPGDIDQELEIRRKPWAYRSEVDSHAKGASEPVHEIGHTPQ